MLSHALSRVAALVVLCLAVPSCLPPFDHPCETDDDCRTKYGMCRCHKGLCFVFDCPAMPDVTNSELPAHVPLDVAEVSETTPSCLAATLGPADACCPLLTGARDADPDCVLGRYTPPVDATELGGLASGADLFLTLRRSGARLVRHGGNLALKDEAELGAHAGPLPVPVITGARVVVAFDDAMPIYDATDLSRGALATFTPPSATSLAAGPSVLADGTLVLALSDGSLRHLRDDGTAAGPAKAHLDLAPKGPGLATDGNAVFVSVADGRVARLDKGYATVAWLDLGTAGPAATSPVLGGPHLVVVGTSSGALGGAVRVDQDWLPLEPATLGVVADALLVATGGLIVVVSAKVLVGVEIVGQKARVAWQRTSMNLRVGSAALVGTAATLVFGQTATIGLAALSLGTSSASDRWSHAVTGADVESVLPQSDGTLVIAQRSGALVHLYGEAALGAHPWPRSRADAGNTSRVRVP